MKRLSKILLISMLGLFLLGYPVFALAQDSAEDDIYKYTFVTDDNDKTLAFFKDMDTNCDIEKGNVFVIMKRDEIPTIVKKLVGMDVSIYAVNQSQRSLEQDFISMTTGTKTQIR